MKQILLYLILFFSFSTLQATTYTVINANASGAGSLLEAIDNANLNAGSDSIDFNIPGLPPHIIPLDVIDYIDIAEALLIDGTTQPDNGYTGNCPKIVLDASAVDTNVSVLMRVSAENVVIYGLWFKNFINSNSTAIYVGARSTIIGTSGKKNLFTNVVSSIGFETGDLDVNSNYFGCDCDGLLAESNSGTGIYSWGAVDNVTIRNNVIASNNFGVLIGTVGSASTDIIFHSNLVGTDVSGTYAIGNMLDGANFYNISNFSYGGSGVGEGNLISGNGRVGTTLVACSGTVYGNKVGTDITGNDSIPNDPLNTQYTTAFNCNGSAGLIADLTIGGMGAGEQNVFFGNNIACNVSDHAGTYTVTNNLIGQTYSGLISPTQGIGFQLYYDSGSVVVRNNYLAGNKAFYATQCRNFIAEDNIIGFDYNNDSVYVETGFSISTADSFSIRNNVIAHCDYGVYYTDCNDSYLGENSISKCMTPISMRTSVLTCHRNRMDRNALSFNEYGVRLYTGSSNSANDDILPPVIEGSTADSTWGTALPFALVDLCRDTTLNMLYAQGYDYSIPQITADASGHWVYLGALSNPNSYTAIQTDLDNNSSAFAEWLTLGTNELSKQTLVVFPVPAEDHLYISRVSNQEGGNWKIYNVMGELLKTGTLSSGTSEKINVRDLPAAYYFIQLETASGLYRSKFLKD